MTIEVNTLLLLINTIIIVGAAILYFKKNYVVLSMEDFQSISQFIDEHSAEEEASRELAGGTGCSVGFGADYLEDDDNEEEE